MISFLSLRNPESLMMEPVGKESGQNPNILPEIWITPQIKKPSTWTPSDRRLSQSFPATALCRNNRLLYNGNCRCCLVLKSEFQTFMISKHFSRLCTMSRPGDGLYSCATNPVYPKSAIAFAMNL